MQSGILTMNRQNPLAATETPELYLRLVSTALVIAVWFLDHFTPHSFVPAVLYTVRVCLAAFGRSQLFTYGLATAAIFGDVLQGF